MEVINITKRKARGFPGGSTVKNPPASAGAAADTGSIPGSGISPGGGPSNLLQCSYLENPMDRGTRWATAHRSQRLGHDWSNSACMQNLRSRLQYSCLENPMDGGAWWGAVHGVAKSWTRLSTFTFTFHSHALEREMATHSSVLAWRIPGTAEPGGLPSMGSHRVGHDWSGLAAAAAIRTPGSQKVWNPVSVPLRFFPQWSSTRNNLGPQQVRSSSGVPSTRKIE